MIAWMNFYPMVQALLLSLQSGQGTRLAYAGLRNYEYLLKDTVFRQAMINNFLFLLIQVPVMLALALVLATLLNDPKLKFRGLFRTLIFLPCATSLVSYSIIFRALFDVNGFVNTVLIRAGILSEGVNWLNGVWTSRAVVVLALIWRWTGYNMVFYLAGLQSIEGSIYEAALIDGAHPMRLFASIILPLLPPVLVTVALLVFTGIWNDFQYPLYVLGTTRYWPMTLAIYNFFGMYENDWNYIFADILLTCAPAFLLFLLGQKQIISGLTSGAVKG